MNVNVNLKEWKLKEVEGAKKIAGTFEIKAGATVVSTTSFNGGGYQEAVVPFSTQLQLDIENLTDRVAKEVVKHFTGVAEATA